MSTETLYSQHSFLFPFKWDIGNKTNTYDKRTNLNDLFNELKEKGNWDYYRFEPDGIETAQNYNEYEYFYSYVRNSLYNYDDKVSNETVSIYYEHKEYKKEKKKKYVINTGGESYNLFIKN